MTKTVCIYHGNCADGFTAAWVVRRQWLKECKLAVSLGKAAPEEPVWIAGVYQTPPPLGLVKDANVVIVDFSYKRIVMEHIISEAAHVTWIDHHKTALEDMQGVDKIYPGKCTFFTDLKRSGAGLAWDYFFSDVGRPPMIDIVEDRDLWKFKYLETRPIQAYIFSFEYTWENWDRLEEEIANQQDVIVPAGEAIERKHFKDIHELLPICTRHIRIAGHIIPVANLPYTMVSDAGNILATRNPTLFGICYYDGMTGRNFSLRSVEGGLDVSQIAAQFGGGGHAKAAGFRVSFEKAKEFEIAEILGAPTVTPVGSGG